MCFKSLFRKIPRQVMSQINEIKTVDDLKPAAPIAGADLWIVSQSKAIRKATVDQLTQRIASQVQQKGRIQLRVDSGYIQWQYIGDKYWQNLISLEDLQGAGSTTRTSTSFVGDGAKKVFYPVVGITSTEAHKCTVVVGGLTQTPIKSFTVSPLNNGSLIFDEAPPDGIDITIDSYQ